MPLGRLAAKALDPVTRKRGFASARLLTDWDSVVGRELAALTRPERLTFPRGKAGEGGTLVLSCASGDALEVQHMRGVIQERVNAFLGWAAIGDIRLQAGRAPKAVPEPVSAPAPTPSSGDRLADALGRLGRAVDPNA